MIPRAARAAPALVAAIALMLVSRLPAAPLGIFLVIAVSIVVPRRAPLDKATSRLTAAVVAILVVSGVRAADFTATESGMRAFAFGVGLAPLAVVASRHLIASPEGGLPVDVALSLLSLLACGSAKPGPMYAGLVAAFVASVVVASRAGAEGRPALRRVPGRAWWLGAAVVTLATGGAVAFAISAMPAARYLEARFNKLMVDRWSSRTGFTDSVRFGRVTRLLASRSVVMRVSGARITHLRGVALDHYEDERWSRETRESMVDVPVPVARPVGADVVEIRPVRVEGERLFAPLEARELSTPGGAVRADSMGALRHQPTAQAPTFWLRTGPRDALLVAPPREADLQVPGALRDAFAKLARSWTQPGASPEETLASIERHLLSEYSYSANYARRTQLDAVAEFLFVSKVGHCEAFASAMTLLARSVGVPARLVVGYRVGERNPVFSHWVVRESNAHAWVEAAGADGAWRTYDPTPMGELPQDLAHDEGGLDAVGETLATVWARIEAWLSERTVVEFALAAVAGLVVFAALRLRRARREGGGTLEIDAGFSRPLDAFVALERASAARGLARAKGETLERWAERLPAPVADAVRAYAAHRYGGGDDEHSVSVALARAAAALPPVSDR